MSQHFSFGSFDNTNASNNSNNSHNTSAINVNSLESASVMDPSPLESALSEMKAAEWNDELALRHLPALSASLSSHFHWMNFLALNSAPDTAQTSTTAFPQQVTMQTLSLSNESNANHQQVQDQLKVQNQQLQSHPLANAVNVQDLLQLMNPPGENEPCVTPVDDGRPIIAATVSQHSPNPSRPHDDEENNNSLDETENEDRRAKSRRLSLKTRHFASQLSSSAVSSAGMVSEQLSPASSSSSSSELYSKNRVDAREARKRKRSRVLELENTIQNLQKELKDLKQLAERQHAHQNHYQQADSKLNVSADRKLMRTAMNAEFVVNNSIGVVAPPEPLSTASMSSSSAASSPPLQAASGFMTPASAALPSMSGVSPYSISVAGTCPPSGADCQQYEERMKALLHSYIFAAFEEAKQAEKYDVSAVIKKYHHDPEKAFQALVELQAELKKRKSQASANGSSASPTRSGLFMEEFMSVYRQWLAGASSHFASLAHHVHPTLPLHFLHWLSNQTDSFYADRSSLWHALFCDELAFSPQQMKELNTLRQNWKKNSKATAEVEKCFGRLKELIDKQKKMELEEFQQIRNIFSPLQMAKFLNWARHFAAICIRL